MEETTLYYEEQTVYEQSASRVGVLHTPLGEYRLPGVMPSIRTSTDLDAVQLNREAGLEIRLISPYASQLASIGTRFGDLFFPRQTRLIPSPRPLVLADVESEALSFNCVARQNYQELDGAFYSSGRSEAINMLMRTGFDTDVGRASQEAHAAWHQMERDYGYGPLIDWTERHLAAARSDVMLVPTPIMRKDVTTVRHALDMGERLLPLARRSTQFTMFGLHFLIHADMFDADTRADEARRILRDEVANWGQDHVVRGAFLSIKLYDPLNALSDPDRGRISRMNLSDLLVGLQDGIQASGGVIVVFNVGNRALGFVDSGTDVVGIRLTGKAVIDRQFKGRRGERGSRPTPPITLPRSMVDEDPVRVRRVYEQTGAFPVPSCLTPEPYWSYPYWEALKYAARARCGVFVDLGEEYSHAARDTSRPLREAVASRVHDAGNSQELLDLCPSVRGDGL